MAGSAGRITNQDVEKAIIVQIDILIFYPNLRYDNGEERKIFKDM